MTNYKPHITESITINGCKIWVPNTARILSLYDQTDGSNTADTFQTLNGSTPVDYQVPAGKNFILVGIIMQHNATAANLKIYSAEAANGIDEVIWGMFTPNFAGRLELYNHDHSTTNDVEGGNYLTLKPSTAGLETVQAIGYEI